MARRMMPVEQMNADSSLLPHPKQIQQKPISPLHLLLNRPLINRLRVNAAP